MGAARFLRNTHQPVVRPARAVEGCEVARHDVKNVVPRQPACGFVEDSRRQLFVLNEHGCVWFVVGTAGVCIGGRDAVVWIEDVTKEFLLW